MERVMTEQAKAIADFLCRTGSPAPHSYEMGENLMDAAELAHVLAKDWNVVNHVFSDLVKRKQAIAKLVGERLPTMFDKLAFIQAVIDRRRERALDVLVIMVNWIKQRTYETAN